MSWQEQIKADSGIWHGVIDYAQERIGDLTNVCCSPDASDKEIRAAQAAIQEMQRLMSLPQVIKATTQQRQAVDRTKGY